MKEKERGKFFVFEGIGGAGKTPCARIYQKTQGSKALQEKRTSIH